MREKVVGNAVCQVRTSQSCCGANPRDCHKENEVEEGKLERYMYVTVMTHHSCLFVYLLVVVNELLQVNLYFSYSSTVCHVSTAELG